MNRRTALLIVIASVLSSALTLAGAMFVMPKTAEAQPPGFLVGNGLAILDTQGRTKATIQTNDDGRVFFYMYDNGGNVRVGLSQSAAGSSAVTLTDRNGTDRAALFTNAAGMPFLSMYDVTGTERLTLAQTTQGPFQVQVRDGAGQLLYVAP